jgi:hypothetical protein
MAHNVRGKGKREKGKGKREKGKREKEQKPMLISQGSQS